MIRSADIHRRSIGVNLTEHGAEICVWAPQASRVSLEVENEHTTVALEADAYGYWTGVTKQLKPHDLYRFRVDDALLPDPASVSQPEGVHGPSQALDVQSYPWTDQEWKNPPLNDYILYELHVGTFTPEGTFQSAAAKIPHLKSLGITAVELMPLSQFPGERNWGYDGVYPYAVQNSYGGAAGFQQFVNQCHNEGIAVVLDVVYNHLGPEGNYVQAFGPYFTDKYKTPWGQALNADDAWCDGVRHYVIENAFMWFRDFHIDALRLDAVHAIKDFGVLHILQDLRRQVDLLVNETWQQHHLIIEMDLNDPKYIQPLEQDGYGMDAQWVDEFHHALRVTTGQDRTGYYEDFNGIADLAKAYRDAYVYDGQYSIHRHKMFGGSARGIPAHRFIVFSQNHDHVGNRMLGERTASLVSFELQKLMAASVILGPYVPLLFMGEEYGETNPFLYFISHSDRTLIENVRKGRKAEFAAFHALGEAPDPQDDGTFLKSKLQWHLLQEIRNQQLLSFYRELIRLRKQYRVFREMDREQLLVTFNAEENTLQLYAQHESAHILLLMNFSDTVRAVNLVEGHRWHRLLDSAASQWGGSIFLGGKEGTVAFEMAPQSCQLYTAPHV